MFEAHSIRQKCVFHALHDTSWLCVMIKRCGYSFKFNLWDYRHEFSWLIIVYSFKVKAFLAVIDSAERMMVSIHIDRSLWIRIGTGLQILEGTDVWTACPQGMVSGGVISREDQEPLEESLQTNVAGPESVAGAHIFEGEGRVDSLTLWGPGLVKATQALQRHNVDSYRFWRQWHSALKSVWFQRNVSLAPSFKWLVSGALESERKTGQHVASSRLWKVGQQARPKVDCKKL